MVAPAPGALPSVSARALFAWPPQAAVARPVAKTKIYAHAKPRAAVRALFARQVESITWAYKLAPETINLLATPGVPEIEVFEIALKLPDIDHGVLRCIDKAIPRPIVFVQLTLFKTTQNGLQIAHGISMNSFSTRHHDIFHEYLAISI